MSAQPDLFSGESLKAIGIQKVLSHNADWSDLVIEQIRRLGSEKQTFTAEDLRKACGNAGIPHPKHHNGWGAVFRKASQSKIIVCVGNDKNHMASAHSRIVGSWRLL